MATVSDRRIIDSSFTLAPGDSLQLTEAGSITEVTSAAAVVGMGGNSLTIDGDIMAGFSTGILLLAGSNTVRISDTGSVFGKLAISANAPVTLFNDGQIIGTDQGTTYGVFLANSGSSVFNSGNIYGSSFGIGTSVSGNELVNRGLIEGLDSDGVLMSSNGNPDNVIDNFGKIDGGRNGISLNSEPGTTSKIFNNGIVEGRQGTGVSTTLGNDVIRNLGLIKGNLFGVTTGDGNDVLDNSFVGIILGPIDMGSGDDLVFAGQGAESIAGNMGRDTISYLNHPRGILINLTGQLTSDGFVTDTLSSFENAVGSDFNDTIYGDDSAGGNVLDGGRGGSDQMFGGGGSDTVSYASAVRDVLINLTGQVTSDGVNIDTLSAIENAIGSPFNDTIYGNDFDNLLDGGVEGFDQIFGGLGFDTVSYATSARNVLVNLAGQVTTDGINNDTLSSIENAIGSAFNDSIYGNGQDNVLDGGPGVDFFFGSGGNDTFVFRIGQANGDTIADFAGNGPLPGDMLQFVGYGAGTFTQVDATHWQVNSQDGLTHETITFQNGAGVHSSEVLFV